MCWHKVIKYKLFKRDSNEFCLQWTPFYIPIKTKFLRQYCLILQYHHRPKSYFQNLQLTFMDHTLHNYCHALWPQHLWAVLCNLSLKCLNSRFHTTGSCILNKVTEVKYSVDTEWRHNLNGGISPLILYLGIIRMLVVIHTPWPHNPRWKFPDTHWVWSWLHRSLGHFGEDLKLLLLQGFDS